MVNATEMAKPFGKRPAKWLELPSAKEFLCTLQTIRKSDSLIQTIEGKSGGTWMHEDVALEFARWLSPAFAIWCNDRIKELLTTGSTAINNEPNNTAALREASEKIKKTHSSVGRMPCGTQLHAWPSGISKGNSCFGIQA